MIKKILFILLLILLLAACTAAPATPAPTAAPTLAPTRTPGPVIDFEIKDLSGSPARLSDLRGQVVLVTFWASWCTACKETLPVWEAYAADHQERGFMLLGVNTGESAGEAAEYLQAQGYTFTSWSDPAGKQMMKLNVGGLPYSFVLDRQGRRVAAWYGGADRETLAALIDPLLADQ